MNKDRKALNQDIENFLKTGGKIKTFKAQAEVSALKMLNKYSARCSCDLISRKGRQRMQHAPALKACRGN